MKILRKTTLFVMSLVSVLVTNGQNTYNELEILTVNSDVTTVITASEPIRFVDISTDKVAGDQPITNVIRLKPKESSHEDGECLGIVTIVTERYRTQYALLYTTMLEEAVSDKEIHPMEKNSFNNPAVTMSTEDMYKYARRIWTSPAMYRNVSNRSNKIIIRLNNIYSAGDYFFIDYSLENLSNIRFDIDQTRVRLMDKKVNKSTNSQIIEIQPEIMLEERTSFKKGYRNVLVIRKMTFPNDKVLNIEVAETQISGRTISINIDYEDVLSADGFSNLLLTEN